MDINRKNVEAFYQKVESFIGQMADLYGLPAKDLELYYQCDERFDIKQGVPMSAVYERLLGTLQNRQSLPNIIKFWHPEYEKYYKKVLCDFDPKKVVKKYGGDNGQKRLFEELNKHLHWNSEHSKLPEQWCEGAVDAAKVLSEYKGSKELHSELMDIANKENGDLMKIAENWDKRKIKGLGFALSCDFLKEIGIDLPKPDVHIVAVIKAVFFDDNDKISETELTDAFIRMANLLKESHKDMTAYKLDKMIWLICTGNFYLHKDAPKTMRECLIKKCV